MVVTIYDYANRKVEVNLPDKKITKIFVHILSGDETGWFQFEDDTIVNFDASYYRFISYDDGYYYVTGKDIQKWLNFKPTKYSTLSYTRQYEFEKE